jgi:hypothetical protein
MAPTAAFTLKVAGNPSARSRSTESKAGEKMVIVSRKFRSNAFIELPPASNQQPKRVPVLLFMPPKAPIKEEREREAEIEKALDAAPVSNRVSLSFNDALPEYSGFLMQYSQTPRRPKLEPILFKATKIPQTDLFGL